MTVRLIEGTEFSDDARIDQLAAIAPNAHFTQHPGWMRVPHADRSGRWAVAMLGEGRPRASALVRIRTLPIPGLTFADIFRGPMAESPEALGQLVEALPKTLAPYRPAAIRIDPYWSGPGANEAIAILGRLGYRPMENPPWHRRSLEIVIDVPDDPLAASFKAATRRQVRKAVRMETEIREGLDSAGLAEFARLYALMADSKGASSKQGDFFAGLADYCVHWPRRGFVLSSWDGGALLGAISVFTLGRRAIYAFGASSLERPDIPKSHLLHFEAMRRARDRGCNVYDFGGFAEGVGEEGARTATQKINYFKSGFGGRPVDFVAGHEKILRPLVWRTLRSLDRMRGSLHRPAGAAAAPVAPEVPTSPEPEAS